MNGRHRGCAAAAGIPLALCACGGRSLCILVHPCASLCILVHPCACGVHPCACGVHPCASLCILVHPCASLCMRRASLCMRRASLCMRRPILCRQPFLQSGCTPCVSHMPHVPRGGRRYGLRAPLPGEWPLHHTGGIRVGLPAQRFVSSCAPCLHSAST